MRKLFTSMVVMLGVAGLLLSPALAHAKKKERHPEIHKAMKQLENAEKSLEKAAKDFGGHKQKAIDAVKLALDELNQALAFDANENKGAAPAGK